MVSKIEIYRFIMFDYYNSILRISLSVRFNVGKGGFPVALTFGGGGVAVIVANKCKKHKY